MITFDANVEIKQRGGGCVWDGVPEWTLRYDCFLGDIRFTINDLDFSTHWGWVPVLDFALGITTLLDSLGPDESRTFEFTESEATISLRRIGNEVEVASSYSRGTARVDFDDLRGAAHDFLRNLSRRLLVEHPALRRNAHFIRALRRARVAQP